MGNKISKKKRLEQEHENERVLSKIKGPTSLPVVNNKLSVLSQKSGWRLSEYKSYARICSVCNEVFGVSASDQKKWYEKWKLYIFTGPSRCRNCQNELKALLQAAKDFPGQLREKCSASELCLMKDTMLRLKQLSPSRFDSSLYNRICNAIEESIGPTDSNR